MKNDNLKLWESVEETDPNYTKKVTYGNKFTSINATYQIKNATSKFGLYGDTWGIKTIEYEYLNLHKDQVMVLARAVFHYPNQGTATSFPISSTIMIQEYSKKYSELQVDDEWAKKIETDITTKALSKLGFNADVFLGLYDDNKYINALNQKYTELPIINDETFSKYLTFITEGVKDKKGVLIDIAYLKARHTLNKEQENEILDI